MSDDFRPDYVVETDRLWQEAGERGEHTREAARKIMMQTGMWPVMGAALDALPGSIQAVK